MDVLSDALRVIRLNGSLFLTAEFREPWCVDAPGSEQLAAVVAPHCERMAICHLVVEGRCWAQLPGEDALPLEEGDVVVLSHGHAHLVGSGDDHAPPAVRDAVKVKIPALESITYGGDGAPCQLVCGWFGYERHVANPVMSALPPIFSTRLRDRSSGVWLESAIRYALGQAKSDEAGSSAIADKLAEVLFVESLRGYLESLPERQTGWLAGLRDPVVGRSIALLHEAPARDWTVASLAQEVHVSRTVLAERFAALVGVPPMQYLTQWRVALAAHLLRTGRLSMIRIAEEVGYDSEAAFSRAFKREYGVPPGAWRRRTENPGQSHI